MFYSHTILARKSPLGTVWIAAHLQSKIKKPQIDGIDIPTYADSIMCPEVPIALRLSGHLLLGLVRIYSWKVNYLFQDCNRMVTTIRTAFASVQVDLPAGADHAPFESITLPATLNLVDLDLDDATSQINTPDNHQKTLDQITLPDENEYVMIDLDSDVGQLTPVQEPIEKVAGKTANEKIPVDPSPGNVPVNSDIETPTDTHDPLERMRRASQSPALDLTDLMHPYAPNDDPMIVDDSPFVPKQVLPSPYIDGTSSGQQIPGRSISNTRTPNTVDFQDSEQLISGNQVPVFVLEPSPPQVQPPPQERGNKRIKFDSHIVHSNEYMMEQINDKERLNKFVHKRRKVPQSALDLWKFSRLKRNDSCFLEPLVPGMCSKLHEIYERNIPCLNDHGADCASRGPNAADKNDGGQDAPLERQPSPKCRGNDDVLRKHQPSPKSPGTVDEEPEPQPTSKPPESVAAQDCYMSPELPRFSPVDMPSPSRGDDSPFKTLSRTPPSQHGGTGYIEKTPSDGNYSLPGQSTAHTMASLFPINEDEDLPDIPGLISTPGGGSHIGTGVTGSGSMSARTRAVAQFFKDHIPFTSSDERCGKFSLNGILDGKTRKQAARMFFETTVLKTFDYIDVQQEEPYGDIEISVKPSLSAAKL